MVDWVAILILMLSIGCVAISVMIALYVKKMIDKDKMNEIRDENLGKKPKTIPNKNIRLEDIELKV